MKNLENKNENELNFDDQNNQAKLSINSNVGEEFKLLH